MTMGLLDYIKEFMTVSNDEADDEDFDENYGYYGEEEPEEEYEEEEEPENEPPVSRRSQPEHYQTTKIYERDNKVVSIHNSPQLQVVIVRPQKFDDVKVIADHIVEKRTVVLNLEQTDKAISRRIVDFLGGAAYANNGKIKRIANNTYIITPAHVGLVGTDIVGDIENNTVFF